MRSNTTKLNFGLVLPAWVFRLTEKRLQYTTPQCQYIALLQILAPLHNIFVTFSSF